jgi:catechol 2,3-dioxygenase-like lactoylglutathione lyase family enzyme
LSIGTPALRPEHVPAGNGEHVLAGAACSLAAPRRSPHTRESRAIIRGRRETTVKKLQVQGVHHITIVGSTKQSAVDFWEGALGMPFVFEQPNLGKPDENHLYFDPGDGRLLTVFTNESREDARRHAPREIGCVEHLAFNVSRATFLRAPARLRERGIEFIQRDRGFMDSIYLHDPNGLKIELACYKFETPEGFRAVDVLMKAHTLRVERGDHHITDEHLADAIELLLATRPRLAADERMPSPVRT